MLPCEFWFKRSHPGVSQYDIFIPYIGDEELYHFPNFTGLYVKGCIVRDIPGLICHVVNVPYFSWFL